MADAWVYVDESQGPSASGTQAGRPFWLGALILESPIGQDLIDAALERLRNDPEAATNKRVAATLKRGFFHASADLHNARRALCDVIVERGLAASFDSSQWFFDRDPEGIEGARLHSLSVALGAMSALQSDYDCLHLVVARREGSFEEREASAFLKFIREARFNDVAQMPHVATRFPDIDLQVVNGSHPGVQVCDLVLWAIQRAKPENREFAGDRTWFDRLKLFLWAQGGEVGGPQQKVAAMLGKGVRPTMPLLPGAVTPRALADMNGFEQWDLLCDMAVDIHAAAPLARTSPRIKHLASEVERASALCEEAHTLAPEDLTNALREITSTFVLICDTLPVFDRNSVEACTLAAEKRDLAAEYLSRTGRLFIPTGFSLTAEDVAW